MDADPEQPPGEVIERVRLYLETLQLRMEPRQFEILGRMLAGFAQLDENVQREAIVDVDDEDDGLVTPELMQEFMVLLSIMNDRDEHTRFVRFDDGLAAMVDREVAENPELLAKAHEDLVAHAAQRCEQDEQLRGIARASGLEAD